MPHSGSNVEVPPIRSRGRWVTLLLCAPVLANCSPSFLCGHIDCGDQPPAPTVVSQGPEEARPEPRPSLTPVLVSKPFGNYTPGDTLSVALEEYHPQTINHVSVRGFQDTTEIGDVPILSLAPRGGGNVYVVADPSLNIRGCPSTECEIVGTVDSGDVIEVGASRGLWLPLSDAGSGVERFVHAEFTVLPAAFDLLNFSEAYIRLEAAFRSADQTLEGTGLSDLLTRHSLSWRVPSGWHWRVFSSATQPGRTQLLCEISATLVNHLEEVVNMVPAAVRPSFDYSVFVTPMYGPPIELISLERDGSLICRTFG